MSKAKEKLNWAPKWTVRKFHTDEDYANGKKPYEVIEVEGNLLLNEGIADMLDLIIGAGGTVWNNTTAKMGVGNSAAAASAADTGLIGASKLYKGMEATFPSRSGQTITFRAAYADGEANFAWQEVTVSNATDNAGVNMNRKVTSLGTKASGTWTLDLDITLS